MTATSPTVSIATTIRAAHPVATAANRPNPVLARAFLDAVLAWKAQQSQSQSATLEASMQASDSNRQVIG